jgi:flagellin
MTVINTNVASLVTQNAMSINERVVNRNMAKLSTGLRINSSADDAAGLAIVSNMTSKIQGLDMSVRNANDAISMIQTAEGALGEMVNMVQRMRELAVQSSNATLTNEQRGFLNLEFQELKSEIDRTAKSTDWNGKKILNQEQGTNGRYSFQVGTQAGQTIDIDIPNFAVDGTSTQTSLPISTGAVSVAYTNSTSVLNSGAGGYRPDGNWSGSSLIVNYNQNSYKITTTTGNELNGHFAYIPDTLVVDKLVNGNWVNQSSTTYNINDRIFPNTLTKIDTALKSIPEINNNFNIDITSTADTFKLAPSNSNSLGTQIAFSVSRANGQQPELVKTSSYQSLTLYSKIEANYTYTGTLNSGDKLNLNLLGRSFQYTVTDQDLISADIKKSILTNLGTLVTSANVPNLITVASDSNIVFKTADLLTDLNFSTSIVKNQNPVRVIPNSTTQISTSSLDTVANSNSSITSVDLVLNNINAARSNFGAKINRLSHTIDNLTNISMNLTASRSRIQDTDYAKAMSDLAKAQIIQQASTAMLAQANSSKQYVLKLLQA